MYAFTHAGLQFQCVHDRICALHTCVFYGADTCMKDTAVFIHALHTNTTSERLDVASKAIEAQHDVLYTSYICTCIHYIPTRQCCLSQRLDVARMAIEVLSVSPQQVTSLGSNDIKNDDHSVLSRAAKFIAPRVSIVLNKKIDLQK